MRKYYIITIPNPKSNIQHALEACIGEVETQSYSLDETKVYIKTDELLIQGKLNAGIPMNVLFPPGITTEYIYEDILVILSGPEWTSNEEL